jgi:Zn-dependent protease
VDFSISTLISRAIVLLIAMTLHEFAHAYVAHLMGDDTAKEQGRMTLNPLVNINPMGYIIGVLVGFGILGSAPVNSYRMRNPRWGMFYAVLAGPLSNLMLAALVAIPFRLGLITPSVADNGFLPSATRILTELVYMNVLLFVFNLLPLFPLDGWTVMYSALPPQQAVWWQSQRQNSTYVMFGLIALSFLGPNLSAISPGLGLLNPLVWLIGQPTAFIFSQLLGLGR